MFCCSIVIYYLSDISKCTFTTVNVYSMFIIFSTQIVVLFFKYLFIIVYFLILTLVSTGTLKRVFLSNCISPFHFLELQTSKSKLPSLLLLCKNYLSKLTINRLTDYTNAHWWSFKSRMKQLVFRTRTFIYTQWALPGWTGFSVWFSLLIYNLVLGFPRLWILLLLAWIMHSFHY